MKKIIGLFFIFIFVSIISSCFSLLGDGSNTLVKEDANSKHSKKAILFLREAGATVANSYQVSVTDYKTEFDTVAVGNVFTVDDDHGKANLNPKAINFNWIADDTVEISYDKNLRTFIQEKKIDGVAVVYKTK
ncbi:hypothetical protein ACPPVU_18265 [Mucilaginibacter sp. McL0603]|uniref:hypothetical protein n=1 Tax=Mucilaginibacter sp. McL0603 TaxID=3415670 RepID=UPI003CFBA69E